MANTGIRAIPTTNHPAYDAFNRLRVGTPLTLFDSKLLYDKSPLFWDEATVSGSGMTSTYLSNESAVEIACSDATSGSFVRQTFQRFNYQPGKSQRIFITGILDQQGGGSGITQRLGYFDDRNGVYFQVKDGVFSLGKRSETSGAVVDTTITQAQFNGRQFPDGGGVCFDSLSPDLTKTLIFAISFEWLGVGSVIYSLIIDAQEYVLHIEHHSGVLTQVYMRSPNLPIRYELTNDGTGGAAKIKCICSSVISEGGSEDTGDLRYISTEGTHLDADSANTLYALIGIRLKPTHLDCAVKLVNQSLLSETADDFEWCVVLNPTVAGTFTYSDLDRSSLQTALGATANTVTGGIQLAGGYGDASLSTSQELLNSIRLGASISGVPDEIVLCVRPLSVNLDIQGGITIREQI